MTTTQSYHVYVGTYTRREPHVDGRSEGIYQYHLNGDSGALTHVSTTPDVVNPSYLAFDPQQRYLYAVNEVGDFDEQGSGAISAFSVDPQSGGLTFLNQQSTHGPGPCYVTVDARGRYALVANYGGGSLAAFPILADGGLAPASEVIQHQGSSVNPRRQGEPHAHSIVIDPGNRFVFGADLGIDRIMIYQLDPEQGKLIPNDPPWAQVQAGAGPRHFTFHPNRQYAYLITELSSTVVAFAYNETRGALQEIQTISTLPDDFSGQSHCADIHVHPSGRFLYGSNRGHDSIVAYRIDETTGRLTLIGHASTQGRTPRNFVISPDGGWLLAANQNTSNVASYRIDPDSGRLTPSGQVTEIPTPVCLKLVTIA